MHQAEIEQAGTSANNIPKVEITTAKFPGGFNPAPVENILTEATPTEGSNEAWLQQVRDDIKNIV